MTAFLSVEVALFLVVKVFLALVVFFGETALFFDVVADFVNAVFFVIGLVDFFATLTFLDAEAFLTEVTLGVGLAVAARAAGTLRN